ncbi:UNVERIFIED_CONTAM: hypothetical protein Slati_1174800 [Sesamum latifolium]|uniref:SREBP regulating gene protein n=1 Tax=Sesamum latifolium TaxID=2727402 RepID=A0AAW2XGK1_9LAMI
MSQFRNRRHIDLILLPLFILQFSLPLSAIRKDVSLQQKRYCRTTVQGRFFLTDDNGHVCNAFSVDPLSRCCPREGDQFSCQGCNLVSQCCNSYEFCVSCCLNPAMTPKELALKVKIAKPVTAGKYGSVFDFCAGRCRHSSESVDSHLSSQDVLDIAVIVTQNGCFAFGFWTLSLFPLVFVHENAYLSEFHHCFSIPSNSSGPSSTQLEARLAGINIIIGRQGESCDSVCKSSGQSCVPNKLALLNQCEVHTLVFILIKFKLINLFADIILI